ncbi:MAG TPA: ribbon-helix-helix protein, CopG family [Capillimicrobium sp.]|nr:ribbon-helix-helix protein, CopG family [Capillimicrobium sp.]
MSKVIQVRDVPDDVHRRLKARAAEQGRSLSELVREQLIAYARQPTPAEMWERLEALPPLDPGESAADAIRAGRAER